MKRVLLAVVGPPALMLARRIAAAAERSGDARRSPHGRGGGGGQFPGGHESRTARCGRARRCRACSRRTPTPSTRCSSRAASRSGSRSCPRDARRRDRARQRHARRQRRIRRRGLRSADRQAAEVHLRADRRTIPRATRSARTLPMPVPEGGIGRVLIYKTYKDPRTYMMNGKDIVWVRSLSRLPPRRRAAEGLRVHLVGRRGAADDDGGRPAEARVREPERPEQSRDDPRAADDGGVHAVALRRHVLRRHQDAVRPRRAGDRPHRRRADLQRLSQGGRGRGSTRSATCRCRI